MSLDTGTGPLYPFNPYVPKNACRQYVDVREYIGNLAAKKTYASGILFDSEQENIKKYLISFAERNNLDLILKQWEKMMSIYGRVNPILKKNANGEILITIADAYFLFNTRVANFNGRTIGATTYTRYYHTNMTYAIVETWTMSKVLRKTTNFELMNNVVIVSGDTGQIPPEFNIKDSDTNEWGFIPVYEWLNLPNYPYPSQDVYNYQPDTKACLKLENVLNWTIHQYVKELKTNKTRLYADLTPDAIGILERQASGEASAFGFNIDFTNDIVVKVESGGIDPANGSQFKVEMGDPKLMNYLDAIERIRTQILDISGYGNATTGTIAKTEAQTYANMSSETETTMLKRNQRKLQMSMIIDDILKHEGLWDGTGDRPYTFEIKDGSAMNQQVVIQDCILQIQNGLMSREQAIKKIQGLTDAEATEWLKQVDAGLEKDQEKMGKENDTDNNSVSDNDNNNVGSTDNNSDNAVVKKE